MTGKKYWQFKAKADSAADLYLYEEIASWGGGYEAHSAKSFKNELDQLGDIQTLNVFINSPGGDVFEGVAIYNMLKRHQAHVHVHVDGIAASVASVIAMAADTIHMPSNAMMMIHNAWMITAGDFNELRETANRLEKINESLIQCYVDRAGGALSEDELKQLLNEESWLSATECVDYGFCDTIEKAVDMAAFSKQSLVGRYDKTPKELFNQKPLPEDRSFREKLMKNALENAQAVKTYLGGL
ncbi:head maturation protease, ClpP-related [Bacillus sp. FSL W7-1360]